jgi:hypothetical protein
MEDGVGKMEDVFKFKYPTSSILPDTFYIKIKPFYVYGVNSV